MNKIELQKQEEIEEQKMLSMQSGSYVHTVFCL